MIDIYRNKPPKDKYTPLKRYQNVVFKKKYNIDTIEYFLKIFPEEKRGRKNFKNKEILNQKALIYEEIFQKAIKINQSIGSIKENISNKLIKITVSFLRRMDDNKILFVDLDGMSKEDLTNLAFLSF